MLIDLLIKKHKLLHLSIENLVLQISYAIKYLVNIHTFFNLGREKDIPSMN